MQQELPRAELLASVREKHDVILELGRAAISSNPSLARAVGERDLEQLVRAFESILVEALESGTAETRRFVIETAVPAFVAEGSSPADIAQVVGTFAVLLTELVVDLPGPERREARRWLAAFMGEYIGDVVTEAIAAAGR